MTIRASAGSGFAFLRTRITKFCENQNEAIEKVKKFEICLIYVFTSNHVVFLPFLRLFARQMLVNLLVSDHLLRRRIRLSELHLSPSLCFQLRIPHPFLKTEEMKESARFRRDSLELRGY